MTPLQRCLIEAVLLGRHDMFHGNTINAALRDDLITLRDAPCSHPYCASSYRITPTGVVAFSRAAPKQQAAQ